MPQSIFDSKTPSTAPVAFWLTPPPPPAALFSAAAGCAAAGVLAAKPCFCTTIHRNEASKQKFKTRGWASGPLAPTTHYSHMH